MRVGDLPALLGLSRASLFAYRTGKSPITSKAWLKLDRAEREAGITPSLGEQLQAAPAADQARIIESASLAEIVSLLPAAKQDQLWPQILDLQIRGLEDRVSQFFLAAGTLAELVHKKGPKSERDFFIKEVRDSVGPSTVAWRSLLHMLRLSLGLVGENEEPTGSSDRRKKP